MEKILNIIKKFILSIPFLLICFSINHVYADEINIYFDSGKNKYTWTTNNLNYKEYDILAYNQNFKINYLLYYTSYYSNVVFYDKTNNLYILFSNKFSSNNCKVDTPYYIFQAGLECLDENGNRTDSTLQDNFVTILSNKNDKSYLDNIFPGKNNTILQNGDYYLIQNNLNSFKNYWKYIYNNYTDFEVVYSTNNNDFYVNENKLSYVSSQTPEPPEEPQEPEEPETPIYNFNNNKYYVPNYEKGNCVEIIDKDTIRVFKDENTNFYIDYFINSNYLSKTGQVDLNYEKNCSTLDFTNIRYYGNDFPQILFILSLLLLFTIGFPYVLYKRFRKR